MKSTFFLGSEGRMDAQKISFNRRDYAVIRRDYKGMVLPLVVDWGDYLRIDQLEKSWKCHKNGFVSCQHKYRGKIRDVFLHELVMVLKKENVDGARDGEDDEENRPILHINRIGLDNRRSNLVYRGQQTASRNTKKKKRTIRLPPESGIDPDTIPTYIWYLKPHGTHGDRFVVEVGEVRWKTTASKSVSLDEKLDQAKQYLRNLYLTRPQLFDERSMNGDHSRLGRRLAEEFQEIVRMAGYDHIAVETEHTRTQELLE